MDAKQIALDNRIMECLSGSHAYGTSTPTSDIDYRGLFVEPELYVRSPFYNIEQWGGDAGEDRVLYAMTKFMQLLVEQNPNIIELLWVDRSDLNYTSDAYEYLRSNRELLLSSKVKFTFSGYAISQLKRINGHNKWINNPKPELPPRPTDYVKLVHNFTNEKMFKFNIYDYQHGYRLIPYDGNLYGVYKADDYSTFNDNGFTLNTVYNKDEDFFTVDIKGSSVLDLFYALCGIKPPKRQGRRLPLYIVKFLKNEYELDKNDWNGYWTWKKNRNQKRSELEEKYHIDTKHAMHLIRLMRMAKEILTEGVVHVKRADAKDLLEIRDGKYTYDEIIKMAHDYDEELNSIYEQTKLQHHVDPMVASEILMTVQNMHWNKK